MQKKAQNQYYKHFNKQEYRSKLLDNFDSFNQNSRQEASKHAGDGVQQGYYKNLYQKKNTQGQKEDYAYQHLNPSPYPPFASNKQQEDFVEDIPTTKEQNVFLTKRKLKRDILGSGIEKILDEPNISSRNIFATLKQQQQKDNVEGLKKWFNSIAVQERIRVLTTKNYCLTYFLRYLFAKIQKEGQGEFAFDNKISETYFPLIPGPYDPLMGRYGQQQQQHASNGEDGMKGENYIMSPKKIMINYSPISDKEFYFKKQRYLETSSETAKEKKAEEKLINTVRLLDLDMYIDTFSIDPSLISNLDTFYQLLTQCSKSQVFSKGPILLRFDIEIGKWYWDNPQWFSVTSFHTIAEWIVAVIERMLWRGYYQHLVSRGQVSMSSKTSSGGGIGINGINKLTGTHDLSTLHIQPNGHLLTKLENQKVISLLMGDTKAALKFWQSTDGKTRHELMNNAFQTVEHKILKENLEKDIFQQACTENVQKLSFPFFYNLSSLKKRLKKEFDLVKSKATNIAPTATLTSSEQSISSTSSLSEQPLENSNEEEEVKSPLIKEKSKKGSQSLSLTNKKSTFGKAKNQSKDQSDLKKIEFYPQTFNPLWKVSDFAISTLRSCGNIGEFIGRQIYYHTYEKAKNAELDRLMEEEEKRNCQPTKKKNKKKKNKNKKVLEVEDEQKKEVVKPIEDVKVEEVKEEVKKPKKKNKNKKKDAGKFPKQISKALVNSSGSTNFDEVFDYDVHDFAEKQSKTIIKQVINNISETDDEEDDQEDEEEEIDIKTKCWQIIDKPQVFSQDEKSHCNDIEAEKLKIIEDAEKCVKQFKEDKLKSDGQIQTPLEQPIDTQPKQQKKEDLKQKADQTISSIPTLISKYHENSQDQEEQEEQQINGKRIQTIPELQNIPITWTDQEDQADDQLGDDQDQEDEESRSKASINKSQKSERSLTSSTDLKSSSQQPKQPIQQKQTIQPKQQDKKPRKRKHNNKKKNTNNNINKIPPKQIKSKSSKKQQSSSKMNETQTLPAGSIPSTLNSYGTIQGTGIPNVIAANQITFSQKVKKGLIKNQVKKQKPSGKGTKGKSSKYDSFPQNYYPDMVQNPCLDPFMMNIQFQQFFSAAANALYQQQQQQQEQKHQNQPNDLYPEVMANSMYMQQRPDQQQNQQYNPMMQMMNQEFLQQPSYYPQMNYQQHSPPHPTLNKSDFNSSSFPNFQQSLNINSIDQNMRASSQGCLPKLNYSSSLANMQNFKKKSVNSTNSCSTSGATTPPSQSSLNFLSNNKLVSKPDYNLGNVSLQPQVNQNSPIRPQRQKNILPGSFLKAQVPPFEYKNTSSQVQETKQQHTQINTKIWNNSHFPSLNQKQQGKNQDTKQNYIFSDQEPHLYSENCDDQYISQQQQQQQQQSDQQDEQQDEQQPNTDHHFKYQNAQDLSYDDPSYYSIYPNPQQLMQATATSYFQTVLSQQILQQQQQQQSQCNSALYNSPQSCMVHMKRFTVQKEQKLYISLSSQIQKLIEQIDSNVFQLKPLRLATIRRIEKSIKSRIVGEQARLLKVEVFGSHRNQLALQTSDIDIAICGLQNTHDWRSLIETMDELAKTFRLENYIKSVRVIDTATVPIIKLQIDLEILSKQQKLAKNSSFDFQSLYKRYTNGLTTNQSDKAEAIKDSFKTLKVDISFDESFSGQNNKKKKSLQCTSHNGLSSSNYIIKVLKTDHRIRMIVIILKKILYLNQLNEAYHGGFSSYVIILLVQAYFKQFYISHTNYTPGKLLMDFLDFIGNRFDNYNCTVQSNQNPPIIKTSNMMMDNQQKSMIRILDPLTSLNAAKGAYKTMDIKCLFSMIHCKLMHSGIEPAKKPLSVILKTRLRDFDSPSC